MGHSSRGVWRNLVLFLAIASSPALAQIVQLGPGESSGDATTISEEPTVTTTDSESIASSAAAVTTTADEAAKTVPVYQIPIEPVTFEPFPIPAESSVSGAFVDTNPAGPPPVRLLRF